MRSVICGSLLRVLAGALLNGQDISQVEEAIRIGPGVTPPRLLKKKEPNYTADARANAVQGTVFLQIVVSEKGRATRITVLSPLGFGLDEEAQKTIEGWEFAPGVKNGKAVAVLATVEVNFLMPDNWFDKKAEQRRTKYNLALYALSREKTESKAAIESAVKSIEDLAQQKFPAAMHMSGVWEREGSYLEKNVAHGTESIHRAADMNYGPALYEVAIERIKSQDIEKGLAEMRRAATLGSAQAQFYLGNRYEKGDGVDRDSGRAKRYFRLCSGQGVSACQYRLGMMLLETPRRLERDYVQAVALIQLANEQGLSSSAEIALDETAKLTAAQIKWVEELKKQLVRK